MFVKSKSRGCVGREGKSEDGEITGTTSLCGGATYVAVLWLLLPQQTQNNRLPALDIC